MITLQELNVYLNELLQIQGLNDYCKNGIQVEGSSKVSKIATAVSASLETIEKAVELGVDVLLIHHGLFWNSDPHEIMGIKKKKIFLLLKHDISLIAYHLPLDAHQTFGNNWKAAIDMGWTNLKPFGLVGGIPIGVMGTFKEQTREQFQQSLENYYGNKAHIAPFGKEQVKSAALVSGGAYKYIHEAIAANVDCFITGNFDEPVWNIAQEEKMNFFALGHSATERIGPKAIGEHLQSKFNLNCTFIEDNNPF